MNRLVLLPLLAGAVFLAGCQSGEQTEKAATPTEAPKPAPTQAYSGREAFQRIFVTARGWAPDAQPYRIESIPTSDANGQDGKAAIWRVSFASPSRRTMRTFTWSGSTAEGAPERGIMPGVEDTYNPGNRATKVFDLSFLKVDSEQALKSTQEPGGSKILKEDPEQQIFYTLEMDPGRNVLTWYVTYGNSPMNYKRKFAVNATTGGFLREEK